MQMIYLSPHLDDVALSCGGLIWEQTQAGQSVEIWTICAGDPPPGSLSPLAEELHRRWGVGREAPSQRRDEDVQSCTILGCNYRHFEIPDAIYRRHPKTGENLYYSDATILGEPAKSENQLIKSITSEITKYLPESPILVSPLTLGNHVDHQITRAAVERMNVPLAFYADYPYIENHAEELPMRIPPRYQVKIHPISNKGIKAWQDSITAHKTQISTFWKDERVMRQAITRYHHEFGGIPLWVPINPAK